MYYDEHFNVLTVLICTTTTNGTNADTTPTVNTTDVMLRQ